MRSGVSANCSRVPPDLRLGSSHRRAAHRGRQPDSSRGDDQRDDDGDGENDGGGEQCRDDSPPRLACADLDERIRRAERFRSVRHRHRSGFSHGHHVRHAGHMWCFSGGIATPPPMLPNELHTPVPRQQSTASDRTHYRPAKRSIKCVAASTSPTITAMTPSPSSPTANAILGDTLSPARRRTPLVSWLPQTASPSPGTGHPSGSSHAHRGSARGTDVSFLTHRRGDELRIRERGEDIRTPLGQQLRTPRSARGRHDR